MGKINVLFMRMVPSPSQTITKSNISMTIAAEPF